jgi:hypothetical protein
MPVAGPHKRPSRVTSRRGSLLVRKPSKHVAQGPPEGGSPGGPSSRFSTVTGAATGRVEAAEMLDGASAGASVLPFGDGGERRLQPPAHGSNATRSSATRRAVARSGGQWRSMRAREPTRYVSCDAATRCREARGPTSRGRLPRASP